MAKIILNKMHFYAFHGHYPVEQVKGGKFTVDVELEFDDPPAIQTDELGDTVNYAEIYDIVKKEMSIPSKLLEHVAGRILHSIREKLGSTGMVRLKVSKLNPPLGIMESVSVELEG